jgi:hypothetical protein
MKFNIKLFNYKRLYIHFCLLALLNIFFSTENIQAKTFSINDIEISTPFEINFDKNKIIDEGFCSRHLIGWFYPYCKHKIKKNSVKHQLV